MWGSVLLFALNVEAAPVAFRDLAALPTYVINLDRRTDRWQAVEANLREFLGADAKLHRVAAVDGKALDYSLLDLGEQTLPGKFTEVGLATPGAIGCYESHTKVWRSFLESGAEYATVLEDDAYFDADSKAEFEQGMQEAKAAEVPYDAAMLGILTHRGAKEELGEKAFRLKGRWWGTHGYVMNRKFAQDMLADAYPMRHQIDAYLGQQAAERDDLRVVGMRTVVKQGLMGTDVQRHFHDDFSEQVLEHGHTKAKSLLEATLKEKAEESKAAAGQSFTSALLKPLVALLEKSGALEKLVGRAGYDGYGYGYGYPGMYGLQNYEMKIYGLFDVLPNGEGDDHTVYPFLLYGGLGFGNQPSSSMLEVAGSAASTAMDSLASKLGQFKDSLLPGATSAPGSHVQVREEKRVQMVVQPEATQEVARDDEQKVQVRRHAL